MMNASLNVQMRWDWEAGRIEPQSPKEVSAGKCSQHGMRLGAKGLPHDLRIGVKRAISS